MLRMATAYFGFGSSGAEPGPGSTRKLPKVPPLALSRCLQEVAEGVGEDRHSTLFAQPADLAASRDQVEQMMYQNAAPL
jgi:hypothetical protein